MLNKLKLILIGAPLPTYQLGDKKLNKIRALAAFSPFYSLAKSQSFLRTKGSIGEIFRACCDRANP